MRHQERFDPGYYDRHYRDPSTRVADPADTARLADHVGAALRHFEIPVARILDAGCGLGFWRAPLARWFPAAEYLGIEISEHLCRQHGFVHASLADPALPDELGGGPFDLVICQGVLQYLDDAQTSVAVRNLGKLCAGALYLEALTLRDWRENADRTRTDGRVHLRSGAWYRRRFARHFRSAGAGILLKRSAGVVLWELEEGR